MTHQLNLVFGEQFENAVKKREKEFASYDEIKLFMVTWNLGGFDPTPQFDLTNLFNNFEDNGAPEIVVFGMQEMINLTAKNLIGTSNSSEAQAQKWTEIILNNLKKYGNYIFVKERNLVGVELFIFAKDTIRDRVKNLDTDIVKTGMAGALGNKGGVIIKFYIDDSSFAVINCHLEAGNTSNSSRLMNLIAIHEKAFQEGGVGRKRVKNSLSIN